MTSPQHRRRRLLATGTAAALALTLAACTTEPDETTPTPEAEPTVEETTPEAEPEPEPEVDPEEALKQQNIAEAKQRIHDFYTVSDEVISAGYEDWHERLEPFYGMQLWTDWYEDNYAAAAEQGLTRDGEVRVVSMTVTDYRPSASFLERVRIDTCVDYSGITAYDGDGNEIERGDTPERFMVEYLVTHHGEGTWWRFEEITPRTEETC